MEMLASASERDEPVDAIALERVDVPGEQYPGPPRRAAVKAAPPGRRRPWCRGRAAARCPPRPPWCRAGRPPRRPARTAPHARRAPPAAGAAGSGRAEMKASRMVSCSTTRPAGSVSGGTGPSPKRLTAGRVRKRGHGRCWTGPGPTCPWARPSLAAAQHVQADVGRDPYSHSAARTGPQPVERLPGADHGLLYRVVGVMRRPDSGSSSRSVPRGKARGHEGQHRWRLSRSCSSPSSFHELTHCRRVWR